MYSLPCIKCHTTYDTTDPDPYYCEPCLAEHKRVAAEIDAKLASEGPREREITPLEAFDAAPKVRGFMKVSLDG